MIYTTTSNSSCHNMYRSMLYTTTILLLILCHSNLHVVHCHDDTADHCDVDCGTNGVCRGTGTYIPGCIPDGDAATGEDYHDCEVFKCVCDYGFTGDDCGIQYETCSDRITTSPDSSARQCFNGGKCEEYSIDNPSEYEHDPVAGIRCNCQSLPNDTIAYAGHQCEFPAEHVCVKDVEHSTYAFCVNNGTCKEMVEYNEDHPLCDCQPGYIGRHCQFKVTFNGEDGGVEGKNFQLAPADEIEYVNLILHGNETKVLETTSSSDDERSGGMKFFIILIVFGIMSGTCYIYLRRRRGQTTTATTTGSAAAANNKDDDAAWDSRDEDIHHNSTIPTKNDII